MIADDYPSKNKAYWKREQKKAHRLQYNIKQYAKVINYPDGWDQVDYPTIHDAIMSVLRVNK